MEAQDATHSTAVFFGNISYHFCLALWKQELYEICVTNNANEVEIKFTFLLINFHDHHFKIKTLFFVN